MRACESLFTHLKTKEIAAGKYLVRHLLGIQQSIGNGDLDNVNWLPGLANPTRGMTNVDGDMIPALRLFGSGAFHSGILRPLTGVSSNERAGRWM